MQSIQHLRLQVSTYDRIQGSLVAAVFIFGFLFAILFAIWWSSEFQQSPRSVIIDGPLIPRPFTEVSFDQNDILLLPFPPTAAPQLSSDLEAVEEVVSTVLASETSSLVDGIENSEGSRELGPIGLGGGTGIQGEPNPASESKRWSMFYENQDIDDYVEMLKYFEIEIGVVRLKTNEIIRVNHSDNGFLATSSGRAAEKASFYFNNTKPTARRWDAKIVRDLKVDLSDAVLVHFYPEQSLQQLRAVEAKQAAKDGKAVEDILTTEFSIAPSAVGYEFQVREIEYR